MTESDPTSWTLSVVVPLLDERGSLEELHRQLVEALEPAPRVAAFELILVDDGSRDGSGEFLDQLAERDGRVRVVHFRRNFGKAAALSCGFRRARGEVVATMDADLQDVPAEVPRLLEKLAEGHDLVSGWKRRRRDPLGKTLPSRLFNATVSRLSGVRLHDHNCGLKVYRREVTEEVDLYGELHRFVPVLAAARGFRVGELDVEHRAREHGASKYGLSRLWRGLLDFATVLYLTRYLRRPMHLFGVLGLALAAVGVGTCGYLTWLRLATGSFQNRYPLLWFGILCIVVGMQFVSVGVLGEAIQSMRGGRDAYAIRDERGGGLAGGGGEAREERA